jgi:hypothetical protein
MMTSRGKGRMPTHIDTAAAWQQQQQLAQLRRAAASLPDAGALPVKAAQEVRRVLLLLQRSRERPNTSSSSRDDLNPSLDVDAALDVAASHIRSLLHKLQPTEAAAACVHAHLFAAWVRGVTATPAGTSAADNTATAGSAAANQDVEMSEATVSTTVPAVAHAGAAGARSTWGPIFEAWTLSSYQYGRLLLLLKAPGMLLDQLAWVQLPGATNMPWQQQQQQQQRESQEVVAAGARLSRLQLMLLAEVCCAVPALAVQLLQQLLPPCQAAVAADTAGNGSASSGCQLAPIPAVLLLCLCAVAGSTASVSAFSSQLGKLSCLHVVCHAVHMLLPTADLQEQSQVQGSSVAVPQAVLQLISNAAATAAKAHGSQQQQQQQTLPSDNAMTAGSAQQPARGPTSNSCRMQGDTSSVTISHQQLLAGLLQLLQDLLLQWGDSWYSSSSGSSTVVADIASMSVEGLQSQLSQVQHKLQQLLPQYLAGEQKAPDLTSPPQQVAASSFGSTLLQQLLPVSLSHQLLVHTNSRLALTLMMMQMSDQQQQKPSQQPAAAAATQTTSNNSDVNAWAAVCDDPFGRAAQQLLHYTTSSSSEQQQIDDNEACSTQVEHNSSSRPGWLSCFAANQAEDTPLSSDKAAADAVGPHLRLPCSFLRMRYVQQQQQQQAAAYTAAAPVFTAAAQHGCTSQQQQEPVAVQAAASHLAGLAAAWLTPGYSLGSLLQPPTGYVSNVGSADCLDSSMSTNAAAAANGSNSSGISCGATDLLAQVSTAAGTSTYGHLRVCCCLVQMLLHVVSLQHQQQQQQQQQGCSIARQPHHAGLVQLLLAMLAEATQQLEQPELQQALLSALHPTSKCSTTHLSQQQHQQEGDGWNKTLDPAMLNPVVRQGVLNPWAWLRQQLSAPDLAAAASRGLVAASNKLVQASEEEDSSGAANAAGVVTRVVLPQQRREALLLAELSRVLLLYQALWPELTVRRLLLDAVQHRWVLQHMFNLFVFKLICLVCGLHSGCCLMQCSAGEY